MKAWKKQLALALAAALLVSMTACGDSKGESGKQSSGKPESSQAQSGKAGESSSKASSKKPSSQKPAESSSVPTGDGQEQSGTESGLTVVNEWEETPVPDDVQGMLPLIQAHITAMQEGMAFDVSDPSYFWWVMKYTMDVRGENDLAAEMTDEGLRMPRQKVQEFAGALFADYSDLPEIPSDVSEFVHYDESWDAYVFTLGGGGYNVNLADYELHEDGTQTVTALLGNGGSDGSWKVELVPNPWIEGISAPVFVYSISSIQPV